MKTSRDEIRLMVTLHHLGLFIPEDLSEEHTFFVEVFKVWMGEN